MEFNKLKVGEVLSTTMYVTVLSKNADSITVKDSAGREFTIKGPKFIEDTMHSSEQYTKEEKTTQTKAAEILTTAGDTVFKADFVKKDGSPRTMVARLLENENLMGRSNVIDLEKGSMGQIDHRTLKSLIIKNVKYLVKAK